MSGAAALDLRIPIGALFTALGLLLAGYGLATGGELTHPSPVNLNLWWGLVMLAFGLLLLVGASRARRRVVASSSAPTVPLAPETRPR
jgi:hypothetical protein